MKRAAKPIPPRSARLFTEPHPPATPADVHTASVDGASRGNPGPASYAVIVRGPDGKTVFQQGKYLGIATNNAAEYHALITALDYAAHHGIRRLRVNSDSELLVRQMEGRYRVRSRDLKPLHERAAKLANVLEYFDLEHVPREANRDADTLANEALDRTGSRTCVPADEIRTSKGETRRVRARYLKGALVPTEPLDLREGAEIVVEVHLPPKN